MEASHGPDGLPSQDGWQWRSHRSRAGPKPRHDPARSTRLQQLASRFLAWRAQRETLRVLQLVDAATLRDLGITDIESAVYGDPRDRMRGYDGEWWRKGAVRR